jgi:Na+/H+-translocating membrane pyrophosphatase
MEGRRPALSCVAARVPRRKVSVQKVEKTLICLGIALVVGLLMSRLAKLVHLPAVTAYLVGGLLIGATIVAIPRAIFMGNSGGAFDNAKKYIESGSLGGHGKGSDAHKASVVGDTVGDTRKDVVGVALDIFIKTMSTVANTLATVFQHITLIR